jgi:tetratricopeptide (TPR) repeat protein
VYLHVQALEDARRGRKRALDLMDLFARSAGDAMFIVVHGRWLGHAYRGDAAAARAFRQQVEIVTVDDVWRRKAYLFVEAELHALSGDLTSLVQTGDAIAALAASFPGWAAWLSYCRGEERRLRGELEQARVELQAALAAAQPGVHRAYGVVAPAYVELLLALGAHEQAAREATAIVEHARALTLDAGVLVAAERVGALAWSALGRHDDARRSLAGALALARELDYGGLPLARLYLTEARVELAAGASESADAALQRTWPLIEHAEAPALFGAYERVRTELGPREHEGEVPQLGRELRAPSPAVGEAPLEAEPQLDELAPGSTRATLISRRSRRPAALLDAAATPAARAQAALALLLEESAADAGHLLLFGVGGVSVAASIGVERASERLLVWAQQYVDQELGGARRATSTTPSLVVPSTPPPLLLTPSHEGIEPCLLSDQADGSVLFVGLALLVAPRSSSALGRGQLVQTVSRALLEAGDCVPLALEV